MSHKYLDERCEKCGEPIVEVRLRIRLCGCPLTEQEERLLRSILERKGVQTKLIEGSKP